MIEIYVSKGDQLLFANFLVYYVHSTNELDLSFPF